MNKEPASTCFYTMTEENNGIINRVASSALVTLDLEQLYRAGERVLIDVKEQLYEGLILREKDFRAFVKGHDWASYTGKYVAITCSAEAIVPTWAYMLLAVALEPFAEKVVFGDLETLETILFQEALAAIDWGRYQEAKVVVKGCSRVPVPVQIYVEATSRLRAIAASIMYGEPCSTVPLFKKKIKKPEIDS